MPEEESKRKITGHLFKRCLEKKKRKKQATLCHILDINYCIQKMPGKKENKNRLCHILDINYCI